jgi:hypothetical protein
MSLILSASLSINRSGLVAETQNAGDDQAQRLIHRDEKKAGEQNHENNKPRRYKGLAARGPRNLGTFGAYFLKEFQRVSHIPSLGVPSVGVVHLTLGRSARKPRERTEIPCPCDVPLRVTISWQKASPKNQGAEPEGRAPQCSLIINRERNANSIFGRPERLACRQTRRYGLGLR